ncbi:acetate--CoA ligase family protein [Metabacillus arenae]|uniref:Acetate--CoA ligase family protein n=1 Tax=Metabacillus arenae TaxID=2771434 RepID=A0A926NN03_9BACI|nr:acetate--CoA ligase family protein [Metabacillus arenae]MBD1380982.1 acetate--CoA ligase family protein [Metabacillus arenae]
MKEAMKANMEHLLAPKSIALIGVSGDQSRVGHIGATGLMNNLIKFGYQGDIYPINPKYQSIMGCKSYPDIQSLPKQVDCIVIGLKRKMVLPVIEESIKKGIKSAIVITSGFAEDNSIEGKELQQKISEISLKNDFRICGPNCLGIVNVHLNAAASTSSGLWISQIPKGHVAFVSQSGALSSAFLSQAETLGVGFSHLVSTGNEADLHIADYIMYMAEDPNTKVIAAYIEGIRDGERFIQAAEACRRAGKPLVVYKVGKSEKAEKAARAHTGSLTGSDQVYNALFKQQGVIRAHTLDGLLLAAETLVKLEDKRVGNKIGVLSSSGGAGGVIADFAEEFGMVIPDLSDKTSRQLREKLPSFAAVGNPVDATAEIARHPELFIDLAKIMEKDENVDMMLFCLTTLPPIAAKRITDTFLEAQHELAKPAIICWYSGNLNNPDFDRLKHSRYPVFKTIETLFSTISILQKRENPKTNITMDYSSSLMEKKYINKLRNGESLSEYESKHIIESFRIPVTNSELVQSIEQARQAAARITYPVALKIDSQDILHKSDSGCVELNIKNEEELEVSYQIVLQNAAKVMGARINGVLVQEMLPPAKEVIIGVKNDPQFGPVVMFGLGGIFVEVLKDVSFRIAPFDRETALSMIKETKTFRILEGVRGEQGADLETLADILHKVSLMAAALKDEVEEIDINPLMVFPEGRGAKAADALIIGKRVVVYDQQAVR